MTKIFEIIENQSEFLGTNFYTISCVNDPFHHIY